ncbi:hypothetical protein EON67_07560, partial [archaeon]
MVLALRTGCGVGFVRTPPCHRIAAGALQINVLGTRPREELLYIRSEQALQFLAAMPYKQPVPWSTLFPDASDKVLDLLNRMLQFHPARRISVEGALAHPY